MVSKLQEPFQKRRNNESGPRNSLLDDYYHDDDCLVQNPLFMSIEKKYICICV